MPKRYKVHVRNKLRKARWMRSDGNIRPFLPDTVRMNQSSLLSMLKRHRMVYIKPVSGAKGKGVMRIDRVASGHGEGVSSTRFRCRWGNRSSELSSYSRLYETVSRRKQPGAYLAQKGIHLLTSQGRPFDIRVMVQENPHGRWEVTGMVGRVAAAGKIVTNGSQGATSRMVEPLIAGQTSAENRAALISRIKRIGLHSARCLQRHIPGLKEIGMDIGVDRGLKPWVLEVNTLPEPHPFMKLTDKRMFRRIVRYGRRYGRYGL